MSTSRLADRRIEQLNPNAIRPHKTTHISGQVSVAKPSMNWQVIETIDLGQEKFSSSDIKL
jgi:hypothetical protein